MIILFDDNEILFKGLGLGVLKDARTCCVNEELNDAFEFQMVYPITGQNYDKIRLNRILFCKPSPYSKPQAFRIYRISKPINGLVTVDAFHISYDMNGIPVNPIDGKTLKDTLDKIQNGTLIKNNFHLYTDKTDTKTFKTTNVYNMRALLLGSNDSVLEKYEGELSFDNFNVYLLQRRGANKGAQVRYAKNLKDITHEITYDRLYNGVYPYVHQETTSQSSSSTTDGFTQVYIVGSKPYQDGWLSYSQNGEPYHPVDESPVQVATEGNFYQKVYVWNSTTQRYSERIYNESVTLIDQVGNLLGSSDTPSWIYIDWSRLPTIVCKANADGYFKSASESEWTYHKKGEIIFENSIKDAATNLMLYYSEVIPTTTTSTSEETTTVTHVELDDKIIYLNTDAAKEMKFDRILALDLSAEFQETPTKEQLEAKAKEYIEKHKIGQYKYNTTVSFVDLSTTTEGVQYENIEKIELGDTVKVIYDALGVNVDLRVIKTQYNVLLDRYEKIELGEKPEKISGESVQNGDNVSSLTNDVGYADVTTVNKLIAKTVTADYIKALNAQFSKAQIDELSTARIKVSGLIEATQFELDNLVAKMLTADNAVIKETLEAGTVKVKGDISIVSGEISIENSGKTKVFKVDRDGNVTANAVKITGGELNINDMFTVSQDGILSAQGAQISGNVEIASGSININDKFKVYEDGRMYASNAYVSGDIEADRGLIAGFYIDYDSVHGQYLLDDIDNPSIIISPGYRNLNIDSINNKNWAFIVGHEYTPEIPGWIGGGHTAKFKVATDGTLYAREAIISGKVTSNDAIISGKVTSNDVDITGGKLNIGHGNFVVDNEGAVTAANITVTGGNLFIGDKFSVNNFGEMVATNAKIQNGNVSIINGSIRLGPDASTYVLDSLDEIILAYDIHIYNGIQEDMYTEDPEDNFINEHKMNLVYQALPQDYYNLRAGTIVPTFQVPFWDGGSEQDPPDAYDTYWYVGPSGTEEYALNSLDELIVDYIVVQYNDGEGDYAADADISDAVNFINEHKMNLVYQALPQDYYNLRAGTIVPTFQVPLDDGSEQDPPDAYDTYWYVGATHEYEYDDYDGVTNAVYDRWIKIEDSDDNPDYNSWDTPNRKLILTKQTVRLKQYDFTSDEYDRWIKIEGHVEYDNTSGDQGWNTPHKEFILTERAVRIIPQRCPFEVDSDGNLYASSVTITGGSLHIQGSSAEFGVSNEGKLTAVEAEILGKITATSGYIGTAEKGFTITENAIYNGFDSITSNALSGGVYIGTDGIRIGQDTTRSKVYWTSKTIYINSDQYLDITDSSYPNDNYEGGMFTLTYNSATYKRIIKFTPVKQDHSTLYDAKPIEIELPKENSAGVSRTIKLSLTQSKWFAVRYSSEGSDTSMTIVNFSLATLVGFVVNRYGDVIMRDATVKGHIDAQSGSIGGFTIASNKLTSSGSSIEISPTQLKYGSGFKVDSSGTTTITSGSISIKNDHETVKIGSVSGFQSGIIIDNDNSSNTGSLSIQSHWITNIGKNGITITTMDRDDDEYYGTIKVHASKGGYNSVYSSPTYNWNQGIEIYMYNSSFSAQDVTMKANSPLLYIGRYYRTNNGVEKGFPNDVWLQRGFFRQGSNGYPIASIETPSYSPSINSGIRVYVTEINASGDSWYTIDYGSRFYTVIAVFATFASTTKYSDFSGVKIQETPFYYIDTSLKRVYIGCDTGNSRKISVLIYGITHSNT